MKSYFDDIPYTDEGGNVITTYGLVNLDNTSSYYDEIDFDEHKFYKRTTRIEYSAENLATVQALGVPYLDMTAIISSFICSNIPEESIALS